MKLFFALLSLFFLLHTNTIAMDKKNNHTSDYIIHINAVSEQDMLWAYQTIYPDDWEEVLEGHFSTNFLQAHEELSQFKANISRAVNLSAQQIEIGKRACDIILLIFRKSDYLKET